MGTNMYPSSALLGENKDGLDATLGVDELIESADGFAGVFPGTHVCYSLLLLYVNFALLLPDLMLHFRA